MKPADQKVGGWEVAAAAVFMGVFLALRFFVEMYPENVFVRTFLAGGRFWIAILVLTIIMGWVVAIKDGAGTKRGYQRRSKRSDFE